MNRSLPPPPPTSRAPRWRTLGVLALLVFAAHALVLNTSPQNFGPEQKAGAQQTQAFSARSIEAPPAAPMPLPAATPTAKPKRKPAAAAAEPATAKEPSAVIASAESAEASSSPVATAEPPHHPASAPEAPVAPVVAATPAQPASAAALMPSSSPALTPVAAPVGTVTLPASARLEYAATAHVRGLNYQGTGKLNWRNDGNAYDARMTFTALLRDWRISTTQGQVSAHGLAPTRFSDKTKNEVAAHFEPDKGQITFSANTPTAPWIKGAQDRLSIFFQLGGMLAGNPSAFPPGTTISFYIVGPRSADNWTFRVETAATLKLPFGEMETVKLIRQPRQEFDQTAEIWFAPSLGYLPVRSKLTEQNGDFVDQQLETLSRP